MNGPSGRRGEVKNVIGGRCAECLQVFIKGPLIRDRGNDFCCKPCIEKRAIERAKLEDSDLDDDSDLQEIDEDDL